MSWLKENKHKVLPEIKDYTKDYPELTWKKNLPGNLYFWMSGYNYLIFYYGFRVMPMIIFALLALYFNSKSIFLGTAFCGLVSIIFMWQTIKAVNQFKIVKGTTFYSTMIKESEEDWVESEEDWVMSEENGELGTDTDNGELRWK